MIKNNYFFDIPVYRLTEEKYNADRHKYIRKSMGDLEDNYINSRLVQIYGGAWKYNEIIGWIQLHILGTQIRGEYISNNCKRHVKTRKKLFTWKSHKLAPEISIIHNSSNEEIFSKIIQYLDDCKKELNNRFVDDSQFVNIGRFIDWNNYLNSLI